MRDDPRIDFTTRFNRQRKKAPLHIKVAFLETLDLFLENPRHSQLRNHVLKKKFAGYKSIDVTEDWRALFKEKQQGKQKIIIFYLLGTHKDLYRKK